LCRQDIKVGNFFFWAVNLSSISKQIRVEFGYSLIASRHGLRDKKSALKNGW
jgi:hypothetical protein